MVTPDEQLSVLRTLKEISELSLEYPEGMKGEHQWLVNAIEIHMSLSVLQFHPEAWFATNLCYRALLDIPRKMGVRTENHKALYKQMSALIHADPMFPTKARRKPLEREKFRAWVDQIKSLALLVGLVSATEMLGGEVEIDGTPYDAKGLVTRVFEAGGDLPRD